MLLFCKLLFCIFKQTIKNTKFFVIGSGPETYPYTYVRDPKIYETSEWGTLFTKPHKVRR